MPGHVDSTLRRVFVALMVLVVGYHLVAVTLAAWPPNRYSEAARPGTEYLAPYFTQNWRLFAPEPVSSDRSVRFQAAYEVDGELRTSEWVDWTDVELDLVRQRLVGGRAGYVTNKMFSPLSARFQGLDSAQQEATVEPDPEQAPTWAELRSAVRDSAEGPDGERQAEAWLRYEESVVRLGSAVTAGRWPDAEIVAVRYVVRSQRVAPYERRGGSAAEREAARPDATERMSGWREVIAPDAAERDTIADFDRRHR